MSASKRPSGKEVSAPSSQIMEAPDAPYISLPPLIVPTGFGDMPLSAAAQWIATGGGETEFAADDVVSWKPAFDELLAAITSGAVKVTGVRRKKRKPVPGHLFSDCPVLYPYEDPDPALLLGDELCLQTFTRDSKEEWHDGFNDKLTSRDGDRWSRLKVLKSDVLKLWRFTEGAPHRTGMPGRPTYSKHLLLAELERRAAAGLTAGTLQQEAQELLQWLATEHSSKPQPKLASTKNTIRARFRELAGTK